jgi:hypothetical protein
MRYLTDKELVESASSTLALVKSLVKEIKSNKKVIDEETTYRLTEKLHGILSAVNDSLCTLEQLKITRIRQKTSLVGGGRRKRS